MEEFNSETIFKFCVILILIVILVSSISIVTNCEITEAVIIPNFQIPTYDSGWIYFFNQSIKLNHNIGGNVSKYIINFIGKEYTLGISRGLPAMFHNLTNESIYISSHYDEEDVYNLEYGRIRIWKYD